MAPLGLLAGWSEEAGSLVTVIMTAWMMFIFWKQKQLERWMVVGACFLLIGCGLLLLCPGSLRREDIMLEYAPEYILPAEDLFSARMFWDNFTGGFLPILIWESFLFIPIVIYFFKRKSLSPNPIIPLFTAGGLLVLCAMMFAPEFELRTGFHSTLFLTIGSAAALKEIAPWLKQALVATHGRRVVTLTVASLLVWWLKRLFANNLTNAYRMLGSIRMQTRWWCRPIRFLITLTVISALAPSPIFILSTVLTWSRRPQTTALLCMPAITAFPPSVLTAK